MVNKLDEDKSLATWSAGINALLLMLLMMSFVINCFTLGKPLRRPMKIDMEEIDRIEEKKKQRSSSFKSN
jgi:hypothetical protein